MTSSEELLLFVAVSNVSSDVPIVQSEPTRTYGTQNVDSFSR